MREATNKSRGTANCRGKGESTGSDNYCSALLTNVYVYMCPSMQSSTSTIAIAFFLLQVSCFFFEITKLGVSPDLSHSRSSYWTRIWIIYRLWRSLLDGTGRVGRGEGKGLLALSAWSLFHQIKFQLHMLCVLYLSFLREFVTIHVGGIGSDILLN